MQVLSVDCGFGAIDAVITNSCNIGNTSTCGVQLLGRTWRRLTNNQLIVSFNTAAHCSVRLSTRNPIEGILKCCSSILVLLCAHFSLIGYIFLIR